MTRLDAFDFELPEELIAQTPLPRGTSRLLVLDRQGGAPAHKTFADIVELIPNGALLVLNETKVVPARFFGKRATGGKVELLLIRSRDAETWEALVRAGGSLQPDEELSLEDGAARVRLVERLSGGRWAVAFIGEGALSAADRCGRMPLPPYIRREVDLADRDTYQTVFAREPGAIAAPTAGLHFTPELLEALEAKGVELCRVTLHVGLGTFMPVRCEVVEEHVMESERYRVPEAAQAQLKQAKAEGRPVIACGTTSVRTLEAYAASGEPEGETELFIYPPYAFGYVDGLITNFHLPKSTLLLLVSALAGAETIRDAYAAAVAERYRFYSYGDAMFIPPA